MPLSRIAKSSGQRYLSAVELVNLDYYTSFLRRMTHLVMTVVGNIFSHVPKKAKKSSENYRMMSFCIMYGRIMKISSLIHICWYSKLDGGVTTIWWLKSSIPVIYLFYSKHMRKKQVSVYWSSSLYWNRRGMLPSYVSSRKCLENNLDGAFNYIIDDINIWINVNGYRLEHEKRECIHPQR